MTEPASAVVRRLLESYERGGVEALIEVLAPDSEFVVPPETSAEPDVYIGAEGARRYFAGFGGALDDVRFEVLDVEDLTPEVCLAAIRLSGLGSATRIPVELNAYATFEVRDGLLARIHAYPDGASAREGAQPAR